MNDALVDLTNVSFDSGTGRVLIQFGSLLDQLCLSRVSVKFGFRSVSGQPCSGRVRVKFGFGSLTGTMFRSVRVEFRSGLFRVVYSSSVWIR